MTAWMEAVKEMSAASKSLKTHTQTTLSLRARKTHHVYSCVDTADVM